jgi:hypothetical protein
MGMTGAQRSAALEALQSFIMDNADGFFMPAPTLEIIGRAIEKNPEEAAKVLTPFAESGGDFMAKLRASAAPREPIFTPADEEPGNVVNAMQTRRETPLASNPILDAEKRRQRDKADRDARKAAEDGKTFAEQVTEASGGLPEDEDARLVDQALDDATQRYVADAPQGQRPDAAPPGHPSHVGAAAQHVASDPTPAPAASSQSSGNVPPPGKDAKRTNTGTPNKPR